MRARDHDLGTIGYTCAAQAPNGVIHLLTSMNHPAQHFELNEAWILSDATGEQNAAVTGAATGAVEKHEEKYADGRVRATWSRRSAANGDFVLHGPKTYFLSDGRKHYEANHDFGRKVGAETLWRADGTVEWRWDHRRRWLERMDAVLGERHQARRIHLAKFPGRRHGDALVARGKGDVDPNVQRGRARGPTLERVMHFRFHKQRRITGGPSSVEAEDFANGLGGARPSRE